MRRNRAVSRLAWAAVTSTALILIGWQAKTAPIPPQSSTQMKRIKVRFDRLHKLLRSNGTVRTSTNDQFVFFNPNIFTTLNFSIPQPLLQGRANLQNRAPLMIARTQLLITSEQSEARIGDLVAGAARQYWDAVQARDNIKVQQQSYDLAQKSYERDKLALDLGALPALDIFQSQSQVAQRKVDVIQAQYAYRDALDGVRRLIGADLLAAVQGFLLQAYTGYQKALISYERAVWTLLDGMGMIVETLRSADQQCSYRTPRRVTVEGTAGRSGPRDRIVSTMSVTTFTNFSPSPAET